MMEDKTRKSFFEYLDYPERYKRLPTVEEENKAIKQVGELVTLVINNKALWTNEYGLTVPLTDDVKKNILARLKDHISILQPDTSRFVKEEYWLGSHGNELIFGYVDVYGDEYGEAAHGGEHDLLFRYYLPDEPQNEGRRDTQIDEILKVIKELGLDPLTIPNDTKQKIAKSCVDSKTMFHEKPLFELSSFEKAWSEANKRQLISLKNKKNYL